MLVWMYGADFATAPEKTPAPFDFGQWQHDGPKFAWLRDLTPLVEGAPLTPFVRCAMAGDVASSLTLFGTDGLHYINADYTLALSRLPKGDLIGLAALTHSADAGVATGTATLFDEYGPIGSATATALANPGFTPRSS
jgi:hypothetical protein